MVRANVISLSFCLVTLGCASTGTFRTPRLVREKDTLEKVSPQVEVVTVKVQYSAGIVEGKLAYAEQCIRRTDEIWLDEIRQVRRKPNYPIAGVATGVSLITTMASIGLLSNLGNFSDERSWRTGFDGKRRFQSDREVAQSAAYVGIIAAAVATLGAVAALVQGTTESLVATNDRRVLGTTSATAVACGRGPVSNVGIAAIQGHTTLAATTTRDNGEFALLLPGGTVGSVAVVVTTVPPRMRQLPAGTVLSLLNSGDPN